MNIRVWGGGLLNYLYNNLISHVPVHFVRKGFLRLFNRNISSTAVVLMHVRILNFWKITIGDRVVINQYCVLDCRQHSITIGDDSDLGPYTRIWTLGHSPDANDHALYGGPVVIGHHVWIASGVTLLPDIVVGHGAVVAAGAVVHKSVAEKHIVAGNPARFIRMRENELKYKLNYRPVFE